MNLRIEVLGQKAQFIQLDQNLLVTEIIDQIIKKQKLKEQNQQLGLYLNGIEQKKNARFIHKNLFANEILQLKKIEQVKQLEGIKLRFNNEIKLVYVYKDDLNNVLYDSAEKQFSLSKDSFKLSFKDQFLQKQIPLKQNQIDANSVIEVKTENQFIQSKQMVELKLKYQQDLKKLSFDLNGKIFQLEEKAKALFQIKQDICILNDKKILLPDQVLAEVSLNENYCLLIFLKESYQKSLSYVNIDIEYKGQSFSLQVSTDTLISELIDLLKIQNNLTNIDIMMGFQVLPKDQTISQLNIQEKSRLKVIQKQNNTLELEIKIGQNIEKMEVENETVIQELIYQIESNFQLQNIELKVNNGQKLVHTNQTLKQYNIKNGTLLIVESPYLQQIRQTGGTDFNNNNSYIKVSVQFQQQIFQYSFLNNQLIQDLEKTMRDQLNCQYKIQLVYQNKILTLQNTFLQEGITNECLLQCNLLIDKIKIIEKPILQIQLLKVIILFENQQLEQMLDGNTLLETVIQSIKKQFSINQDIYLKTKERNLDSQKTLNENGIMNNTQIFVHRAIFKLFINYLDKRETLEVTYDTLGEELQLQIKNQYHIIDDFDILINGIKINPKQQLKDQGVQNQQLLNVQIKKGQAIKIQEQKNQYNPQIQQQQQQGYQKINQLQNNQTNQQIQQNQYSQQEGLQNQSMSQNKPKSIVITQIEDMNNNININVNTKVEDRNNNINIKNKEVSIKFKSNNLKVNIDQIIQLQWDTTILEIIDYILNGYGVTDQIKLIFKGKTLLHDQSLKDIQIKDNEIIIVEPNNVS